MTKIMLVEDDKSLREIYGVRLLAEGYDIVSAGDGEEALAMAIKERPQLIVSDVMMPKISGFDMLDILRSTTETKNIKVIMMTALSSEEQRTRGESLGADRYLVKSQVGIEDVVHVVHEVLGDQTSGASASAAPAPSQAQPAPAAAPAPSPMTPPQTSSPAQAPAANPLMPTPMKPTAPTSPATSPAAAPSAPPLGSAPKPPSLRTRIIQPLNDPSQSTVDLNQLLDRELAKESATPEDVAAPVSTDQEKALINEQIASFTPPAVAEAPTSAFDVPAVNISEDGTISPETTAPQQTPAAPQVPPNAPSPSSPAAAPAPASPFTTPPVPAAMPQPGSTTPPPPPPPVTPPAV